MPFILRFFAAFDSGNLCGAALARPCESQDHLAKKDRLKPRLRLSDLSLPPFVFDGGCYDVLRLTCFSFPCRGMSSRVREPGLELRKFGPQPDYLCAVMPWHESLGFRGLGWAQG